MNFNKGDLVRITNEGDCWSGVLSEIDSLPGIDGYTLKLLEWPKYYGPYRLGDLPIKPGTISRHWTGCDIIAVSALEQLAMEAWR